MTKWRAIPSTGGVYEASDAGDVRRAVDSTYRTRRWLTGQPLKPWADEKGYRSVTIYVPRRHRHQIHQLVAEAFLGPRPVGLVVNHLDSDPSNNRPENLEYTTYSGNTRHAIKHGHLDLALFVLHRARGEASGTARLTEALVRIARVRYASGEHIKDIAVDMGVGATTLSYAIRRKTWAHVV